MTVTLLTGANKGLGFEAARRLINAGHTVYLGARDPQAGTRAAEQLGGTFVPLDVTDQDSVEAAMKRLQHEHGQLDVLVNNAGIGGGPVLPGDVDADLMRHVYETNVFGVVRVTHAALPLLLAAAAPVIVNVASGLGSLGVITNPNRMESRFPTLAYGSSKTALVAITVHYAKAFPQIRVNAIDPGYTATDLNAHQGTQTITEGTDAIVTWASIGPDGPTGGFYDRYGTVPW
jgi:NAD(P)-dependent dehydrogenase (short-subunit alcohol dehydrogenase family)